MKNFIKNIFIGIVVGLALSFFFYALFEGMGREIERRKAQSEYYCETYGYCK